MHLIKLIRLHQWAKNSFVFFPLFFSGLLTSWNLLFTAGIVFFAYCLFASAIYCFNDIWDVQTDRLHPTKRNRPIASGAISKTTGYTLMFSCLVAGFLLLLSIKPGVPLLLVFVFYFLMNIAYCVKLKQFALVDVFVISLGFVLRIIAGGLAIHVWISHWIVLITFLLALFLAFAKRRDDFLIYEQTGTIARKNIVKYNFEFLNATLIITSTITIVAYILYSVSPEVIMRMGSDYVYVTAFFVLAGILRYLQLTFVFKMSGSPTEILLKDHFIQLCILCWIGAFVLIMYI